MNLWRLIRAGFYQKENRLIFYFFASCGVLGCFLGGVGGVCVFFGVCFLLSVLVLLQFFCFLKNNNSVAFPLILVLLIVSFQSSPERCIQRWHFIQYISPHSVTGENGKEVLLG